MTNEPRQALERLLAGVASPTRLDGRAGVAAHFRRAAQLPILMRAEHLIVHRTDDPEVIVAEFAYVGENTATKQRFSVANVFVLHVREGRIAESRDYVNHAAFARLFEDELLPVPKDAGAIRDSPLSRTREELSHALCDDASGPHQ